MCSDRESPADGPDGDADGDVDECTADGEDVEKAGELAEEATLNVSALLEAATLLLTDPEALDLEPTAVVGYKNRVRHPTEEAYRDLLFTVRLADHVSEVQLHLTAMADAKKDGGSHRLFTLCRQVLFAPTVAEDTYTGERNAEGKPHGQGKKVYVSGNVYEGGWAAGKKEGRGTYRYADGNEYEGEYKGGKKEGRGILLHPDGAKLAAAPRRVNKQASP